MRGVKRGGRFLFKASKIGGPNAAGLFSPILQLPFKKATEKGKGERNNRGKSAAIKSFPLCCQKCFLELAEKEEGEKNTGRKEVKANECTAEKKEKSKVALTRKTAGLNFCWYNAVYLRF